MRGLDRQARRGHVIAMVQERLGAGAILSSTSADGADHLTVRRRDIVEVLEVLKTDADLDLRLLLDVFCVDHSGDDDEETGAAAKEPPFEIVYSLKSPRLYYRAHVSIFAEAVHPQVPSVTSVFASADWYERELWDLFGVYVDGHPHLRRLLLYPGFVGHPGRNDYPADKSQPLVALRDPPWEAFVVGQSDEERGS